MPAELEWWPSGHRKECKGHCCLFPQCFDDANQASLNDGSWQDAGCCCHRQQSGQNFDERLLRKTACQFGSEAPEPPAPHGHHINLPQSNSSPSSIVDQQSKHLQSAVASTQQSELIQEQKQQQQHFEMDNSDGDRPSRQPQLQPVKGEITLDRTRHHQPTTPEACRIDSSCNADGSSNHTSLGACEQGQSSDGQTNTSETFIANRASILHMQSASEPCKYLEASHSLHAAQSSRSLEASDAEVCRGSKPNAQQTILGAPEGLAQEGAKGPEPDQKAMLNSESAASLKLSRLKAARMNNKSSGKVCFHSHFAGGDKKL